MANKKRPFKATVLNKEKLASGFIRLTCSHNHPELNASHKGGYIKLLVPLSEDKVKKRSISIADADSHSITLDFTDHGQTGPAASWARNAKVGDTFECLGPGPAADIKLEGAHFRFLGDRTAFPAMKQQLTRLDGHEFNSCEITLLVTNENEALYFDFLSKREEFKIKIVKEIDPNEYLESIPEKGATLWAAGERKTIKALKKLLKERKLDLVHKYISSYWQTGKDQEEHSFLKKQDSAEFD